MPLVNGKHYPYNKEGMRRAVIDKEKIQRPEGIEPRDTTPKAPAPRMKGKPYSIDAVRRVKQKITM